MGNTVTFTLADLPPNFAVMFAAPAESGRTLPSGPTVATAGLSEENFAVAVRSKPSLSVPVTRMRCGAEPARSGSSAGKAVSDVTARSGGGADGEADFCGCVQAERSAASTPQRKTFLATDETQMKHRWGKADLSGRQEGRKSGWPIAANLIPAFLPS